MASKVLCPTCSEPGISVSFEGCTVYSFPCTAEVVKLASGKTTTIKACPNLGRVGLPDTLRSRSDGS